MAILHDKLLFVSSQGDSTFRVYRTDKDTSYVGGFRVRGVSDSDGIEVTSATARRARAFRDGVLVVHNGEAKVKDRTGQPTRSTGTSCTGRRRWGMCGCVT